MEHCNLSHEKSNDKPQSLSAVYTDYKLETTTNPPIVVGPTRVVSILKITKTNFQSAENIVSHHRYYSTMIIEVEPPRANSKFPIAATKNFDPSLPPPNNNMMQLSMFHLPVIICRVLLSKDPWEVVASIQDLVLLPIIVPCLLHCWDCWDLEKLFNAGYRRF